MAAEAPQPATLSSPPPPPPPPPPPHERALGALLGRLVRVALHDGRVLMGTLTCVDNSANLVVENAFQLSPPPVVSLAQDGELLRVHVLQPEEDRDKLQPVRVGRMLIGSNTWRKCEVERQSAPSP